MFFTTTLLWLHIKLKKWGLTAYEYIIFKEEKQERLEKLQNGLISQEQFDEEEKAAMEDIRKKKKSSIIHQINKDNKKAYKERIIERNRIAREKAMKMQQEMAPQNIQANNQQQKINKIKETNFNEFDNINEDNKSKRMENYDIERNK